MYLQYWPKAKFACQVAVEAMVIQQSELVFIKMVGAQQNVRRVWAHLVGGRPERRATRTDLRMVDAEHMLRIYVDPTVRYKVAGDDFGGKIGEKRKHIDERALRTIYIVRETLMPFFRYELIGVGDAMPPHFTGVLRQRCEVPFKDEWVPEMWARGLAAKLITPIGDKIDGIVDARPTYGNWGWDPCRIYQVNWSTEEWHVQVIKPLLAARR